MSAPSGSLVVFFVIVSKFCDPGMTVWRIDAQQKARQTQRWGKFSPPIARIGPVPEWGGIEYFLPESSYEN
jgi:hypothetical protein